MSAGTSTGSHWYDCSFNTIFMNPFYVLIHFTAAFYFFTQIRMWYKINYIRKSLICCIIRQPSVKSLYFLLPLSSKANVYTQEKFHTDRRDISFYSRVTRHQITSTCLTFHAAWPLVAVICTWEEATELFLNETLTEWTDYNRQTIEINMGVKA